MRKYVAPLALEFQSVADDNGGVADRGRTGCGGAFVVVHPRGGFVPGPPSPFAELVAEVEVLELDGVEDFVEAAVFQVEASADHQARADEALDLVRRRIGGAKGFAAADEADVSGPRNADAGALDDVGPPGMRRIEKKAADHADIGCRRHSRVKGVEPIGSRWFDIVVEKSHEIAGGGGKGLVARGAATDVPIIEDRLEGDTRIGAKRSQLVSNPVGRPVRGAIVNDDEFRRSGKARSSHDGGNAPPRNGKLVEGEDDERI